MYSDNPKFGAARDTAPVKALLLQLKYCKLDAPRLDILPDKLLYEQSKCSKRQSPGREGTDPVNLLILQSK